MSQKPETKFGKWKLYRYPRRKRELLQAFDSADELLVDTVTNADVESPLLVVNDSFGALAIALHDYRGWTWSDSSVSLAGYAENLRANRLNVGLALAPIPITAEVPAVNTVLIKIPKSQSLLAYQLARMAAVLPAGTRIYASAKSKLMTPAIRALFEQYVNDLDVSLAWRKSRVLTGTLKASASEAIAADTATTTWSVPQFDLELLHQPGVFSRKQLDIGARLLLDHLPRPGARHVIDLGCGNGVLGLAYARRSPASEVTWLDESYLAIQSVQQNITHNLTVQEDESTCRYHAQVDDCMTHQEADSADLVLCNPPFHQEFAITDHIARQMFQDAHRVLREGGELRVVGNRHLGYHQLLKATFNTVTLIGSNPKFVVLSAVK